MASKPPIGPDTPGVKPALPLKRQPDAEATSVYFLGGIRAQTLDGVVWAIEPFLDDNTLCLRRPFSKQELERFALDHGLSAIAVKRITWQKGAYRSYWCAFIEGREDELRGSADLWASISKNITYGRTQPLKGQPPPSRRQLNQIMADTTNEERLALSISLSLRSMDVCVEQITDYYNEQLANRLASGGAGGNRVKSSGDYRLFSSIHAFFLHIGSARDYLGALIAVRLGISVKSTKSSRQVDSIGELVKVFKNHHKGVDPLLDLLIDRRYFEPSTKNGQEWEPSGWFLDVAEQRNEFVHRRPYGLRPDERWASLAPISPELGLYRYTRPILSSDGKNDRDILELIVMHYKTCSALFFDLAECSGFDTSMIDIKREDMISAQIEYR